jgi:hypothetical protein
MDFVPGENEGRGTHPRIKTPLPVFNAKAGRDGQIRTADLSLRRRPLYPSELRPQLILGHFRVSECPCCIKTVSQLLASGEPYQNVLRADFACKFKLITIAFCTIWELETDELEQKLINAQF